MMALGEEYTKRYGKQHLTISKCRDVLYTFPKHISNQAFSQPPQCMPDECKKDNTIQAYQEFYKAHKREFATWKNQTPHWFN